MTTADDSTGSVGESSAPRRNDSVQSRSVSACVTTATSAAVSGMAKTSLRSGRCQSSWSSSASTSRPSRNRIRISATTASDADEARLGVELEHLRAALAQREPGEHEQGRQRQEAALREAGQQRADDEEAAEHGDGHLERVEVVHGGNLRAPMESWDILTLGVEPHHPQVLRSDGEARVVAINLPAGEALDDHQVHERAYVVVVDGEVEVEPRRRHGDRRAGIRGAVRPEGAARGAREDRHAG